MKTPRLLFALFVVVVFGLNLVGCGAPATTTPPTSAPAPAQPTAAPAQPTAAPPKPTAVPPTATSAPPPTLVMVTNLDDVVTLDPDQAYETTNLMIHNSTYDTLVEFKASDLTKVAPRLADKWEISPDGLNYTFTLHPGVKFASGNPVTAEDVRFSWTRLKNLKGNPSFYADVITTVEALNDTTVKVTLTDPSPAFLSIVAAPALSVLDSKLVQSKGGTDAADADKTDKAKDWLDQNSAGSGPFIQTSWKPKAEIVLEANPNYWRGKPKLGKVIIKHVADPTTMLQMLQRGDADLVQSLDPDLVEQAKADANLNVVIGQTLDQNYLAMTSSAALSKPLSDKRVRQAVALSIDYDGLIKALLRGYGSRAPSIIPLGVLGVDPKMTQGRDLAKAKVLLKDAGYEKGFTVELAYGSNPTRETIAAKIKADLAEAGITVNLKPMEQSVYLSDMRAQKLAFAFGGWTPDYLDPTMWTDYFSYSDRGIAKRMLYNDPEAEKYAKIIGTELDPAKREQAIKDLQKVLMDDMPFTMLYQNQSIAAMNKSVKGFAYHPVNFVSFFDLSK
jgi:peptide/nickel transport system substrate-binding protein